MAILNYTQIRSALTARESFEGNSMSAGWYDAEDLMPHCGQLGEFNAREYRKACVAAASFDGVGASLYVVLSYSTPIAWISSAAPDVVHRVTEKFSRTTSRHQGMLFALDSAEAMVLVRQLQVA